MCLFFFSELGLSVGANEKKMKLESTARLKELLGIHSEENGRIACGLIILFLGLKCTMWQHNISQP